MSKPLFFCLVASLAAHLALIFCWPTGGRLDGRQPVALRLLPARASLPAGGSPLLVPTTTERSPIAPAISGRKVSPQNPSALIPQNEPILPAEPLPPLSDPAAAPSGEGASASVPVPAAGGDPQAAAHSESLLAATIPQYADNPRPAYPRLAAERGWEGEVLLRVQVTAAGTVESAEVERSSGHPILDRAALKAVARWRFQPARRGPLAVASTVLIPIPFLLQRN